MERKWNLTIKKYTQLFQKEVGKKGKAKKVGINRKQVIYGRYKFKHINNSLKVNNQNILIKR